MINEELHFSRDVLRSAAAQSFSNGYISGARAGKPGLNDYVQDNGSAHSINSDISHRQATGLLERIYGRVRGSSPSGLGDQDAATAASAVVTNDFVAVRSAGDGVVLAVGEDGRTKVMNPMQIGSGQGVTNVIQPGRGGNSGDFSKTYSWNALEAELGPNVRIITASDGIYGQLHSEADIQRHVERTMRSNGLDVRDPNFSQKFMDAAMNDAVFSGKKDDVVVISAQKPQKGQTAILNAFDGVGSGDNSHRVAHTAIEAAQIEAAAFGPTERIRTHEAHGRTPAEPPAEAKPRQPVRGEVETSTRDIGGKPHIIIEGDDTTLKAIRGSLEDMGATVRSITAPDGRHALAVDESQKNALAKIGLQQTETASAEPPAEAPPRQPVQGEVETSTRDIGGKPNIVIEGDENTLAGIRNRLTQDGVAVSSVTAPDGRRALAVDSDQESALENIGLEHVNVALLPPPAPGVIRRELETSTQEINGTEHIIIEGDDDALAAVQRRLENDGTATRNVTSEDGRRGIAIDSQHQDALTRIGMQKVPDSQGSGMGRFHLTDTVLRGAGGAGLALGAAGIVRRATDDLNNSEVESVRDDMQAATIADGAAVITDGAGMAGEYAASKGATHTAQATVQATTEQAAKATAEGVGKEVAREGAKTIVTQGADEAASATAIAANAGRAAAIGKIATGAGVVTGGVAVGFSSYAEHRYAEALTEEAVHTDDSAERQRLAEEAAAADGRSSWGLGAGLAAVGAGAVVVATAPVSVPTLIAVGVGSAAIGIAGSMYGDHRGREHEQETGDKAHEIEQRRGELIASNAEPVRIPITEADPTPVSEELIASSGEPVRIPVTERDPAPVSEEIRTAASQYNEGTTTSIIHDSDGTLIAGEMSAPPTPSGSKVSSNVSIA